MRDLLNTIKALLFAAALLVGVCILFHVCGLFAIGCSPVNVQVQNCQNEVRDASGVTFTGCKADGDPDADGTLRVNIDTGKDKESAVPKTPRWFARLN